MERIGHHLDLFAQPPISEEPFVVYFSSQHCAVCQAVLPRLRELAAEYSIKLVSIDVAQNSESAGQLLVFTVPTVLLMQAGKEILRESRFIDFARIERTLSLMIGEEEENT